MNNTDSKANAKYLLSWEILVYMRSLQYYYILCSEISLFLRLNTLIYFEYDYNDLY